jgi:hypothetical protein
MKYLFLLTKNVCIALCLFLFHSTWAQNINYTISLTRVQWTGNTDNGNNSEEYGLVLPSGISGCASANGNGSATWNGSIIIVDVFNAPPSSIYTGTYRGIENDGQNETGSALCDEDNGDDFFCAINASINLALRSFGTSTIDFTCSRTNPNASVSLRFTVIKQLPVSLERFAGKAEGKAVRLEWSTSAELNNDYFEVEHSADGQNFRSLTQVNGKGTTAERSKYEFLHLNAAPGTNYYRLKQVDNDGTSAVFKVITVNVAGNNGTLLVFPNPATDRLLIDAGEDYDTSKFWAINAAGQRIVLEGQSQNGRFEIQLPVNLPSGMYWLIKESAKGVQKAAFVKE